MTPLPVALAATLHDPSAALLPDVRRALPRLAALYAAVAVATSPPTSARMVRWLRDAGAWAGAPRANVRGPLYRLAIRRALASGAPHVHYLDFDRAVHWMRVAPRELAAVLRVGRRHAVLVVGRTPKAHASHHRPLWATELVANRLMAERMGVDGRFDLLVPSFVLGADVAHMLVGRSHAVGEAVYGEWAALVPGLAADVAYVEGRGLDWETPDRHRRAVRRLGLPGWRRRQETAVEWTLRTAMAATIVQGFVRTHACFPARPRLVRLPPRGIR